MIYSAVHQTFCEGLFFGKIELPLRGVSSKKCTQRGHPVTCEWYAENGTLSKGWVI